MRNLHRLWQHLHPVEAEMLAGEGQFFVGPSAQDDLDRLTEAGGAFIRRHAEILELDSGKAAAGAPIDAAPRQHVEQGHLLGEAQRVVEGRQRHAGADAQAARAGGGEHPHHVHRWADAEARKMVLGEPHRVEAGLVHDLDALQGARIDLAKIDPPLRPAEELQHREFPPRLPPSPGAAA